MAAMNAVLKRMKSDGQAICATLNDRAERFVAVVWNVFAEHGCKFSIHNFGSFCRFSYDANLSFVFQPSELESFSQHLVFNGVYVWEGGTCFISTAHTDADLDRTVRAIETSIIDMRNEGVID